MIRAFNIIFANQVKDKYDCIKVIPGQWTYNVVLRAFVIVLGPIPKKAFKSCLIDHCCKRIDNPFLFPKQKPITKIELLFSSN